jgi:dihydrofolate reductase
MSVIVLVAAVARNGVIGSAGDLPWTIPEDLRRFRAMTMGKPIIMGRATFDSIGGALPGRTNIVLTRNEAFTAAGTLRAATREEALALAREKHDTGTEVCIIGGGQIYELFFDEADRMQLTVIDAEPTGDTFFPRWDPAAWRRTAVEPHPGPPPHEYVTLERITTRNGPS